MKIKTILTWFCATGSLLLAAMSASGLGADHPAGDLKNPEWPEGMAALVNITNRVHGFWENDADVFFFAGSPADFNAFLDRYSKLQAIKKHVLVINDGKGEAKSPWAKTGLACDWELFGNSSWMPKETNYNLEVHFWLGGKLSVDSVSIPANVEITGRCLKNLEAITNGMTRAEVERQLTMDGGLQGVSPVRFLDRACPGFKIKVDFDFKRNPADQDCAVSGADDRVVGVSKPYLELPLVD